MDEKGSACHTDGDASWSSLLLDLSFDSCWQETGFNLKWTSAAGEIYKKNPGVSCGVGEPLESHAQEASSGAQERALTCHWHVAFIPCLMPLSQGVGSQKMKMEAKSPSLSRGDGQETWAGYGQMAPKSNDTLPCYFLHKVDPRIYNRWYAFSPQRDFILYFGHLYCPL